MKMSLDSSGVKAGLSKAQAGITSFARDANQKLGALAKLVSVGLAAAFVGFAKKALDLGTTLSDIATSTNFATEEFQVFRGALIDAGGKAESMEKGINNMQKAIVQGGEGMTTFTRAFDRLGLSVDQLRAMTPEEQFKTIAKAVAEADDQQGAYTSSMEIFGTKVAPRMQEVFKRLAKDGYQKMAKDVEESYGIMDAKTQESLDKAADQVERFKNKATIKVGELISGDANFAAFKALGAKFGAMMAQVGEWLANAFLGAVKHLASGMAAAVAVVGENLVKGFELAGLSLQKVVAPVINGLIDALNKMGFDLNKMDVSFIQGKIDSINFDKPTDRWKTLNGEFLDNMGDWSVSTQGAQDAWNELADTFDRQAKTSGVVADAQKKRTQEAIKQAASEAQAVAQNTEQFQLQQELKEAILRGDLDAVEVIENALELEKDILKVMDDHKIGREEATAHVEAMIKKEKERADAKEGQNAEEEEALRQLKGLELEKIRAEAAGNTDLADELQKRIDKQKTALDLMNKFGISIGEAKNLAEQLAAVNAGPNIDQMQIGGNIENVSRKRGEKDALNRQQRAAQAKEDRTRRAENAEIQRRRNRGEDMGDVMADINARRAKRAGEGGGDKPGAPPPNGGDKKDPKDPNGAGGKGKDPKQPKDPAKDANDKLDQQITLLEDIKAALKC